MGQITDTGRYIPLIEYFENSNTLLRASLRALVAMRLLDLYQSELPGKRRLLIDPDTFELMIGQGEETLWPPQAFEVPEATAWNPQGYIAAVYVSLILTATHPYKGRRYFETAIIEDDLMRRLFIEKPEYVLGADSKAPNAPLPYKQLHVVQLFNSLPAGQRTSLREVFAETGKVWFSAAEDLPSSLRRLREQLWADYSMAANRDSVSIMVEGLPLILTEGKLIALPSTLDVIGMCEMKTNQKTGLRYLGVCNKTPQEWKLIVFKDGVTAPLNNSDINPGEYLRLSSGVNIEKDDYDSIIVTIKQ